jgi:hypothetical protein
MRRILQCAVVGLGIFLAAAVWPAPRVLAQQDQAAEQQKAAEFARLWQTLQWTKKAEDQIPLTLQALELEAQMRQWTYRVRERNFGDDSGWA